MDNATAEVKRRSCLNRAGSNGDAHRRPPAIHLGYTSEKYFLSLPNPLVRSLFVPFLFLRAPRRAQRVLSGSTDLFGPEGSFGPEGPSGPGGTGGTRTERKRSGQDLDGINRRYFPEQCDAGTHRMGRTPWGEHQALNPENVARFWW